MATVKWGDWLNKWGMTSLRIKPPFLEMDWAPKRQDKDAAWELYVELLTRTSTQPLSPESGDEAAALESVYRLFEITRDVIRRAGRQSTEFTKIAVVMLNQRLRPFTTKWHSQKMAGGFSDADVKKQFREELNRLQEHLRVYTKMLADMAGIEDLTELEA